MNPVLTHEQVRRELARADGSTVPSPCVSVCVLNAQSGLCEGCHRSLLEIGGWSAFDDVQKRAVWFAIAGRLNVEPA